MGQREPRAAGGGGQGRGRAGRAGRGARESSRPFAVDGSWATRPSGDRPLARTQAGYPRRAQRRDGALLGPGPHGTCPARRPRAWGEGAAPTAPLAGEGGRARGRQVGQPALTANRDALAIRAQDGGVCVQGLARRDAPGGGVHDGDGPAAVGLGLSHANALLGHHRGRANADRRRSDAQGGQVEHLAHIERRGRGCHGAPRVCEREAGSFPERADPPEVRRSPRPGGGSAGGTPEGAGWPPGGGSRGRLAGAWLARRPGAVCVSACCGRSAPVATPWAECTAAGLGCAGGAGPARARALASALGGAAGCERLRRTPWAGSPLRWPLRCARKRGPSAGSARAAPARGVCGLRGGRLLRRRSCGRLLSLRWRRACLCPVWGVGRRAGRQGRTALLPPLARSALPLLCSRPARLLRAGAAPARPRTTQRGPGAHPLQCARSSSCWPPWSRPQPRLR